MAVVVNNVKLRPQEDGGILTSMSVNGYNERDRLRTKRLPVHRKRVRAVNGRVGFRGGEPWKGQSRFELL